MRSSRLLQGDEAPTTGPRRGYFTHLTNRLGLFSGRILTRRAAFARSCVIRILIHRRTLRLPTEG